MIGWMCGAALAALGPGPTTTLDTGSPVDTGGIPGDTGGAEPPADTGSATDDTGDPFCAECTGAAGRAGEEGGSPCDIGASGGGAWAAVAVFALARRRSMSDTRGRVAGSGTQR